MFYCIFCRTHVAIVPLYYNLYVAADIFTCSIGASAEKISLVCLCIVTSDAGTRDNILQQPTSDIAQYMAYNVEHDDNSLLGLSDKAVNRHISHFEA